MHTVVTSLQNPRLRWLRKIVTDRRQRRRDGVWIAEGVRLAEEVLASGREVRLWVMEEGWGESGGREAALRHAVLGRRDPILVVGRGLLRELSATQTPPGVMLAFAAPVWSPDALRHGAGPLVVLDRIQDPGNLGTIARSAEGAGAGGLVLAAATTDPGNPKALRASAGSLLRLPVWRTDEPVSLVRESGRILLATSGAGGTPYDQADLRRPFALLLGQEGAGLSAALSDAAQEVVSIPMAGEVESLNVATACAVILFEAARQRRADSLPSS